MRIKVELSNAGTRHVSSRNRSEAEVSGIYGVAPWIPDLLARLAVRDDSWRLRSWSTSVGPRVVIAIISLFFIASSALAQTDTTPRLGPRSVAAKRLTTFTMRLATELDPRPQGVLRKIPAFPRRLLAVRTYIKRSHEVATHWTWSSADERQFRASEEYRAMIAHIEAVKLTFADSNKGYRLDVNLGIRSLGSQLAKWNTVRSIWVAGNELLDSSLFLLADSTNGYGALSDEDAYERFREFLRTYDPKTAPTVAVPGLSRHGQLRAFDFRVMQGSRLVAGTSTATIPERWDAPGWTRRLKEATLRVSPKFDGPLEEPYEPWHYEYVR